MRTFQDIIVSTKTWIEFKNAVYENAFLKNLIHVSMFYYISQIKPTISLK